MPASLTAKETEIYLLYGRDGLTVRQVAARLKIGSFEIRKHMANALNKTEATNHVQLAVMVALAHYKMKANQPA